jgi:hypothetical protein
MRCPRPLLPCIRVARDAQSIIARISLVVLVAGLLGVVGHKLHGVFVRPVAFMHQVLELISHLLPHHRLPRRPQRLPAPARA